jgi:hypothetical protein
MPSSTYLTLLSTVSAFVDETKAREVIGRQLVKCGATPETLTVENLKNIAHLLSGAAGLYVADKAQRAELVRKIAALAGM